MISQILVIVRAAGWIRGDTSARTVDGDGHNSEPEHPIFLPFVEDMDGARFYQSGSNVKNGKFVLNRIQTLPRVGQSVLLLLLFLLFFVRTAMQRIRNPSRTMNDD